MDTYISRWYFMIEFSDKMIIHKYLKYSICRVI
jgi:hypothetical protein